MKSHADFHYRLAGDAGAPALVFLHGFLGDLREWDAILDAFLHDHRCLTVDLPGHGKTSTAAFDEEDNLSAVARALLDLLDSLGMNRCALLGYSMGGRLALQMAVLGPARFVKLVLESASPGLRDEAERQRRKDDDCRLAARLAQMDLATFLNEWYAQPMFGDMRRDAQRFDALMKQRLDNDPKDLARALRLMSIGRQNSLWDAWRENRIPTLLLAGERDAKYVGIASEMARLCPLAETRVLNGCGHNVHYDDPDGFAHAVMGFLKG